MDLTEAGLLKIQPAFFILRDYSQVQISTTIKGSTIAKEILPNIRLIKANHFMDSL
jgi:hypothetical protein